MKNLAPIALAIAVLVLSSTTVQADGDHNAPEFDEDSTTISVPENSPVSTLVGCVLASDYEYPPLDRDCKGCPRHEENVILYTLKGPDRNSFWGGRFGGIWTKEGVSYDYDMRESPAIR